MRMVEKHTHRASFPDIHAFSYRATTSGSRPRAAWRGTRGARRVRFSRRRSGWFLASSKRAARALLFGSNPTLSQRETIASRFRSTLSSALGRDCCACCSRKSITYRRLWW